MKVTDLSVTMFNWKSVLWKTAAGTFGWPTLIGLVTVHTDEEVWTVTPS